MPRPQVTPRGRRRARPVGDRRPESNPRRTASTSRVIPGVRHPSGLRRDPGASQRPVGPPAGRFEREPEPTRPTRTIDRTGDVAGTTRPPSGPVEPGFGRLTPRFGPGRCRSGSAIPARGELASRRGGRLRFRTQRVRRAVGVGRGPDPRFAFRRTASRDVRRKARAGTARDANRGVGRPTVSDRRSYGWRSVSRPRTRIESRRAGTASRRRTDQRRRSSGVGGPSSPPITEIGGSNRRAGQHPNDSTGPIAMRPARGRSEGAGPDASTNRGSTAERVGPPNPVVEAGSNRSPEPNRGATSAVSTTETDRAAPHER